LSAYLTSTVLIALSTSKKRDSVKITINRKKVSILYQYNTLNCIMKLSDEHLEKLFSYYLYDILILSNFQQYNVRREMEFTNNKEELYDRTVFIFQSCNKEGKPINMTWQQYNLNKI